MGGSMRINISLNEKTLKKVDTLATEMGLSRSALISFLITKEYNNGKEKR